MPKKEEHYNDFFEKTSKRIAARGKKIAEEVKKKLDEDDVDIDALAKEMVYG